MVDLTLHFWLHTQQIASWPWNDFFVQIPDELNLRNVALIVGTWLIARWVTRLTLVARQSER